MHIWLLLGAARRQRLGSGALGTWKISLRRIPSGQRSLAEAITVRLSRTPREAPRSSRDLDFLRNSRGWDVETTSQTLRFDGKEYCGDLGLENARHRGVYKTGRPDSGGVLQEVGKGHPSLVRTVSADGKQMTSGGRSIIPAKGPAVERLMVFVR